MLTHVEGDNECQAQKSVCTAHTAQFSLPNLSSLQRSGSELCSRSSVRDLAGPPQEQCVHFEAAVYFVESVVQTVSQTHLPGGKRKPACVVNTDPGTVNSIVDSQEAMFHQLLDLHYNDPTLIALLSRLLEAFARLIALRKPLAVPAIQKVGHPRITLLTLLNRTDQATCCGGPGLSAGNGSGPHACPLGPCRPLVEVHVGFACERQLLSPGV